MCALWKTVENDEEIVNQKKKNRNLRDVLDAVSVTQLQPRFMTFWH